MHLKGKNYPILPLFGHSVSCRSIHRVFANPSSTRDHIYGLFNFSQASLANRSRFTHQSGLCPHGCAVSHTLTHILSGCAHLSNWYNTRHDRVVNILHNALDKHMPSPDWESKSIQTSSPVIFPIWITNDSRTRHIDNPLPPNSDPDIIRCYREKNTICIFEVTCPADEQIEVTFDRKFSRYSPLIDYLTKKNLVLNFVSFL